MAGLFPERKGPKRKSKLTGGTVAAVHSLREGGASYRAIAAAVGMSEGSVRNALKPAGAGVDSDDPCVPTGSDDSIPQDQDVDAEFGYVVEVGPAPEVGSWSDSVCPATVSAVAAPLVGVHLGST